MPPAKGVGMEINMRKKLEKYYIFEKSNVVIINFTLVNFIFCIISGCNIFNEIFGIICNILAFIGITVFPNKQVIQGNISYKRDDILYVNRNKRFYDWNKKNKIMILTGDSGTGKSCLIERYVKYLYKKGVKKFDVIYTDKNYFYDWGLQKLENKKYIILDQFEKAIMTDGFKDKVNMLKYLNYNRNVHIILVVQKEYFADVYKAFDFDKNIDIKWLNYDKEEIDNIKIYLQKIIGKSIAECEKYDLYNDILNDLTMQKITFIQLSYVCRNIQQSDSGIYSINEEWIKNKDYNYLVSQYIERQIDKFYCKDLAYIILFLLCQDKKGLFVNEVMDFENVSMCNKKDIKNTLHFLFSKRLIKQINSSEGWRSICTERYEISHNYILEIIEKLCINKVHESIRSNIQFYNKNYQTQLRDDGNISHLKKLKINGKYKKNIDSSNKRYINDMLYIMMIGITIINWIIIYTPLIEKNQSTKCFMLGIINIMVGESIYYVYNYYYRFMSMFGKRYIISIIVGAICCFGACILIDYWAICLGIEIILIGILMHNINNYIRKSEKVFFSTRFKTFTSIGVITVMLGLYFPIYVDNTLFRTIPLFLLYGIYMALGIISHINKIYILSLIGKTILIGKDLD